jgi:hypothetical protein
MQKTPVMAVAKETAAVLAVLLYNIFSCESRGTITKQRKTEKTNGYSGII